MSKDLLLLRDSTIEQAFITGDGVDTAITELTDIVRGYEHNLDTVGGRKKTASLAAKVSKVKTTVDAIGKEMVSEWKSQAKIVDANRKKLRDACDDLRDEARKPLTDWEAEQALIEAERVAAIEAEKDAALLLADHEIGLLLNEKRDDDIAAKIILEAEAAEERKRQEQERMNREATERAERLLVEQKERLERDQAELDQREAMNKKAAERAERDMIAAQEAAALSEQNRIAAEKQAKIDADAAAEQATFAEMARQELLLRQEEEAIQAREANKRHVGAIRKAAKESLMAVGLDEAMAKKVVLAISNADIANVTINY